MRRSTLLYAHGGRGVAARLLTHPVNAELYRYESQGMSDHRQSVSTCSVRVLPSSSLWGRVSHSRRTSCPSTATLK